VILPEIVASHKRQHHEDRSVESTLLGRLVPDTDDPTVALRIIGQKGLLIRAQSIWITGDAGRTLSTTAKATGNVGPASFQTAWPKDIADILMLSEGFVYETDDSGRTWSRRTALPGSTADFLAIAGEDSGTWVTIVGSLSTPISRKELSELPKYADDVSSTQQSPRMLVPAIITSHDHGNTWQVVDLPKAIGPLDSIAISGNSALALGPYAVLISSDKGMTWSAAETGAWDREEEAYPLSATIFGNRMWVSLKNGTLLSGETSKRRLSLVSKSHNPLIELEFTSPCTGFAIQDDHLITTGDGGVTWRRLTSLQGVVAYYATQARVFAATGHAIEEIDLWHSASSDGCLN
jgi:photosystem II stability/assembly factor-like uncharacterized protein